MAAAESDVIDDVKFRCAESEEYSLYSKNGLHRYQESQDLSSDEDEETIFMSDGKELANASKPLMTPRQRVHIKTPKPRHWKECLLRIIYLVLFVGSLSAIVLIAVYLVNTYANKFFHLKHHKLGKKNSLIGCSHIEVQDVWVVGIPKLLTESAFRLMDINHDGTLDILFGFATGGDRMKVPKVVCDVYFNGTNPCTGGILALNGKTGEQLWRHYSPHEIFSLNCNADLNKDGMYDCIGAGRAGTFEAVSGKDGKLLWTFSGNERNEVMNVYTGQYVPDVDGDGVPEILNIHGGDPLGEPGSNTRLGGKIMLFSGRTGDILKVAGVSDGRESYYSPVLYTMTDGTAVILYGTGGETHPGSLWYISLQDFYNGHIHKSVKIASDAHKGFMTPPVMIDITGDGVEDIVFATYNSSVLAVNGTNFNLLWNFTYPWSETYATPSPGYYNDDDVPDFLIRLSHGPGYPLYYHSMRVA